MNFIISKACCFVVDNASKALSFVNTKGKAAASRLPSFTLKNAAISIIGLATPTGLLFLILKLLRNYKPPLPDPEPIHENLVEGKSIRYDAKCRMVGVDERRY